MASVATKSRKASKTKIIALQQRKPLHMLAPWSCVHRDGYSEIKAYVLAAGGWITLARVEQTAHIDSESTANFIASATNNYEKLQNLIHELATALDQCVESGNLSWDTARDAEAALDRAKQQNTVI